MRKPLSLLTAAVAALALTTAAHAETLKVGMITTLSGAAAPRWASTCATPSCSPSSRPAPTSR